MAKKKPVATKKRVSKSKTAHPLNGKIALVTGGGKGMGAAIAAKLAEGGATVVITGRDEAAMEKTAASIGGNVLIRHCDVRNPESVSSLFVALKKQFKSLDIVINNAGLGGPNATVAELSLQDWREVLDTNLTGSFLITKSALPMLTSGATIVFNLSVAAKGTFPGMAAYVASKHGTRGLAETVREEVRGKGIRVLELMPGATNTDIWEQFWPEAPRDRMMRAESIADALVAALALPANASVKELVIVPTAGAL